MSERDFRIVNNTDGQQIEYDQVLKRIGEISYRDFGVFCKALMFDIQKALITDGLRVIPDSLLTVTVPAGKGVQRIGNKEILPFVAINDQSVTIDTATGSPRTDIIEAQVQTVATKPDTTFGITDPDSIDITKINIDRDIKYILAVRKQTDTTTPTAAIAGSYTSTISISGTIDLSTRYLINVSDGEDGGFIEIDCRGATPEATTAAEIINNINTAIDRIATTLEVGDFIKYTGEGTGITSTFTFKSPATDPNLDALDLIFGLSIASEYIYTFTGTNEWFKIAEIDMGASTTVITASEIKDLDEKDTWTSGASDIVLRKLSLNTNDVYANDKQVKILDAGTDGTDAFFTGDISGNADTVDGFHLNQGVSIGDNPIFGNTTKIGYIQFYFNQLNSIVGSPIYLQYNTGRDVRLNDIGGGTTYYKGNEIHAGNFIGRDISGNALYMKTLSGTWATGQGNLVIPHGIANAYTERKIKIICSHGDNTITNYFEQVSGPNQYSPVNTLYNNTNIIIVRNSGGSSPTGYVDIIYIL
jgi:hypothetical protein